MSLISIDPGYHAQDPSHQAWLRTFFQLPAVLQYHFANESNFCLTFESALVDDPRPLFQWIQQRGGLPIIDPKRNYWYGRGVFWFPNSRSRWYAINTAGEYLTRDWWWKNTFGVADLSVSEH